MSPHDVAPPGASRTPVQFDVRTGDLRIGPYERHVDDPAQPEQVYGAYLSLLYAVRQARPGERLALRTADLEALLLIVGDDPATIESRLVELMGCTPAEAGVLGRLLLRQRRATATLGIAAGLSLAGVGLVTQLTGADQVVVPVESSASAVVQAEVAQAVVAQPAPVAPVAVEPAVVRPAVVAPVQAPPAPVRAVVVGPRVPEPGAAPVVAVGPAVPAAAPPAPAAPAPVAEAPAAPEPVVVEVAPEDRYEMPLAETPVMDAPPPADVPESGIGEAVSLEPEVLEPISGIGGSEDHVHEPFEEISGETDSGHEAPPVEMPAAAEPVEEIAGATDSGTHEPVEAPADPVVAAPEDELASP